MPTKHQKAYWETRYKENRTGWDIGYPSPQLKAIFDSLSDKKTKILIPGAGNAYEAEYLHISGYKDTHVVDFAKQTLASLHKRVPSFPSAQLHHENFFDHHGTYDVIIEQTFFCALDPVLRHAYVDKMHELLKPSGKLTGLLFNIPLKTDGPPYGGHETIYRNLFEEKFHILHMATSDLSIPPRAGNELCFSLTPKSV